MLTCDQREFDRKLGRDLGDDVAGQVAALECRVAHEMVHGVWHLHQLALGQICKAKTELDLPTSHGPSRLHGTLPSKRRSQECAGHNASVFRAVDDRGTTGSPWFYVITFTLTVIGINAIQGVERVTDMDVTWLITLGGGKSKESSYKEGEDWLEPALNIHTPIPPL